MLLLRRRNDVHMHDSTLYDSADDMVLGKLRRALFFRCSESVGVLNQQHGDKALGRGKPNLKKHTNNLVLTNSICKISMNKKLGFELHIYLGF